MYADAYATALTVMGSEKSLAFAQKHNIPVFLIQRDSQDLTTQQSDSFEQYVYQQ
jgi:thiamine biosynthesis lipoprotein